MDVRKIVVVVEDVEVARTALKWALHNILRYGDLITLLHVVPKSLSKSKKKMRLLRLKGFQLALSFQNLCKNYPNTRTEIVVTEGDQEGGRIASLVREIGASTLIVGLHDQSFLYKLAMAHNNAAILNCKILAIRQPNSLTRTIPVPYSSTNMDFSQIEIDALSVPETPPPKIPYQLCPDPSAIMWRSRRRII
ncbi:hypothetical protein Leryth_001315 [Lithospermum erythrorhizon]|uniref:Hydrolase n=1 Tax=Lithospermum erythrorhizon TaxID=34254 RepID=A0AAV3QV02_LITER|nr:hypothetical protein Leryth_001315 [Lithospermum erythrorhizon]